MQSSANADELVMLGEYKRKGRGTLASSATSAIRIKEPEEGTDAAAGRKIFRSLF